jgi:hypothetical protein
MARATLITIVAVGTAIALSAGVAVAGGTHDSEPVLDNSGVLSDDSESVFIVGHVDTNTKSCLAKRRVKVLFGYATESKYRLVDVAVSSKNGSFAGHGPAEHAGNSFAVVKLKMSPRDTASGHCTGGSAET